MARLIMKMRVNQLANIEKEEKTKMEKLTENAEYLLRTITYFEHSQNMLYTIMRGPFIRLFFIFYQT
jgi:hypothetical protein